MKNRFLSLVLFLFIFKSTVLVIYTQTLPDPLSINIFYTDDIIIVDGLSNDNVWNIAKSHPILFPMFSDPTTAEDVSASAQIAWNELGFYAYVDVTDDIEHYYIDGDTYQNDCVEFTFYFGDDFGPEAQVSAIDNDSLYSQIRIQLNTDYNTITDGRYLGLWAGVELGSAYNGKLEAKVVSTEKGYAVEAIFPWEMFAKLNDPENEMAFGFDIGISDADEEGREDMLSLLNNSGDDLSWNSKCYINTATLRSEALVLEEEPTLQLTKEYQTLETNDSIDLNYAKTNSPFTIHFDLRNIGKEILNIYSSKISGDGYSIINSSSDLIPSLHTDELIIQFLSDSVATYSGKLEIISNSYSCDTLNVFLKIKTTNSPLEPMAEISFDDVPLLTDDYCDFGIVCRDSIKSIKFLKIKNYGLDDLNINNYSLHSPSSPYTIGAELPAQIEFNDSLLIPITFRPKSTIPGENISELIFTANDANNLLNKIKLKGFSATSFTSFKIVDTTGSTINNSGLYSLGQISLDDSIANHKFLLVNTGVPEIDDLVISNTNAIFSFNIIGEKQLATGDSALFYATISPEIKGIITDTVTINNEFTFSILGSVTGTSVTPDFVSYIGAIELPTENAKIDLGKVKINTGYNQIIFTVKNNGLEKLDFVVSMLNNNFTLTNFTGELVDQSTNISLLFDKSYSFIITFNPQKEKIYSDTLFFKTNDPYLSEYKIIVTGMGVLSDVYEIKNESLKIYPNPANKNISVLVSENDFIEKIELYDLAGKKVKEITKIYDTSITLSDLNRGIYYISITTSKDTFRKKIIVN